MRRMYSFLRFAVVFALALPLLAQEVSTAPLTGEAAEQYQRDRRYAIELRNEGKTIDSLPWFEKLAAVNPLDKEVLEGLGSALLAKSITLDDAKQRAAFRVRAREVLQKSKDLGNESTLVAYYLETVPKDGHEISYGEAPEAEKVMQEAEQYYAKGEYKKAREAYLKVMMMNPKSYHAVLFIGDTYFVEHQPGSAGEWFRRAIEIDPNIETAYRYWGDALMQAGQMEEARKRFIDAIVANPFNRMSWNGLLQWAKRNKVELRRPNIKSPNLIKDDGDKTTITIDSESLEKKDGSSAWMGYEICRAAWKTESYKSKFPDGKYRHSLAEEADAFRMVAELARNEQKKVKKLAPELEILLKLDEQKLIEPYVLFHMADEEVAQDYPEYREKNREKLREYLGTYVAPKLAE